MITKRLMAEELRLMFLAVDRLQEGLPSGVRPHQRLHLIRDQLVLIAVDVGLPVSPVKRGGDDAGQAPGTSEPETG